MSSSRLRAGLAGGGLTGAAAAVVVAVALLGSSVGTASAQTAAPYPPVASPATPASPGPSGSPATPASPAPAAQPAPQAEAKQAELTAELPAATPAETRTTIAGALDNAADAFAAAGLTAAQQVEALESLQAIVNTVAVDSRLTQAQVLAAINTARAIVPSLIGLPDADRDRILAGMTAGIAAAATAGITGAGTQQAVIETVTQAVSVLAGSGSTALLTADVVKQLVQVTAGAVSGKTAAGDPAGVVATTTAQPDGSVRFSFSGLKPGSTAVVILNVTDAKVAAALRAALGSQVIAYSVDANGRATLVLTGTANELGTLVVNAPGSALGASTATQAQAAVERAVLGLVGSSANGSTAVFAIPADGRPATPSITARRTPVVPVRGAAVLTGTAQPGTTVQLYGRTASGAYRLLRTALVDGSGAYSFTVYPQASMRFLVKSTLNGATVESVSTVVGVRAAVSQAVTRTATRTYRFSGRISPAQRGALVNVFYSTATGSVLAAQARTAADGTWAVTRTFSGTGTFPFFARAGRTTATIGGTSSVQRITIR